MTITNHPQTIHYKKRMPRDVWIFMQGYHASSIPARVTWYDDLITLITVLAY